MRHILTGDVPIVIEDSPWPTGVCVRCGEKGKLSVEQLCFACSKDLRETEDVAR
jgi:hypothetical protein